MPTPFYHLSLAEEILNHPKLPGALIRLLQSNRCNFLFGNTAPDVQVVSGQPRLETHFFNLPIQSGDRPAWEQMLADYPQLATTESFDASHAAFLAGYLCHLQADWFWVSELFTPYFGPRCSWGTFKQRLYYHNILRAYLDRQVLPGLHLDMDECLRNVKPQGWMPFVKDQYLAAWRDLLFPQLQPGASIQTVEVFSSRQGISAPEFYATLESEERMRQEILIHIPPGLLHSYRQRLVNENVRLLSDYLAFSLHPLNTPGAERAPREFSHEAD